MVQSRVRGLFERLGDSPEQGFPHSPPPLCIPVPPFRPFSLPNTWFSGKEKKERKRAGIQLKPTTGAKFDRAQIYFFFLHRNHHSDKVCKGGFLRCGKLSDTNVWSLTKGKKDGVEWVECVGFYGAFV